MSKLVWDAIGTRRYETGVDHGILFPYDSAAADPTKPYPLGVAWNGLSKVSESPDGAEANPQYADNIKYLNLFSAEEFKGTIEAFTYPDEFAACDGSKELAPGVFIGQQNRTPFGLAYRTKVGNDIEGEDAAYKIHLIYGAQASPSQKEYSTINDSPEAVALSWDITTTPVSVSGFKPTALLVIDSQTVAADKLTALLAILEGSADAQPYLPLPDEIKTLVGTTTP